MDAKKHIRLTTRLDLGVMGPAAGGEQEQKAIHGLFDENNVEPIGWEYQIKNDAIVNYTVGFEKGLVNTKYFELMGLSQLRLGTLNSDISAGAILRTGLLNPYFKTLGLYKNADKVEKINNFQLYFYTRGWVSVIAYDATLQGGLFNRQSPYTIGAADISRLTATVNLGVVFSYKRVALEFAHVYTTKQFKTGLNHGWGHCSLSVCF